MSMPDDQTNRRQDSRPGQGARSPDEIPTPGWKGVLRRSIGEMSANNMFLVAGGVTYSMLLALFPGLAALVSVYGLLSNPSTIEHQMGALSGVLPEQSQQMISEELHQLASMSGGKLGVGAVISVLFALWTASRGVSGLMTALDIAYEETERRSFFRFNLTAIVLTLGAIAGGIVAILLIAVVPAAVEFVGLSGTVKWLILLLEWPLLAVLVLVGLAVLYRFAPDREQPEWRWHSPGAITAVVLWILASVAFTVYVSNFNNYTATYGSLGGVIILLTWLYISSLAVLLGAVINVQTERQAGRDPGASTERSASERAAS
jgi:membrane protein